MILLFSETRSDYARYLYPYVVWALPEPGEKPGDLFRRGFLPASPRLDRFYLCRNLRVVLTRFKPSSENRRILRKGEGIAVEVVAREDFDYSADRRQAWMAYAGQRFGEDVMTGDRLDALMRAPVISHLMRFTDRAAGREVGTALLFLEAPHLAYYYYAFYDLTYFSRNLGMFMMTAAVDWFARQGFTHLHLGTCYSERALYKTQFAGLQFFNGAGWSENLEELKFLVRRELQPVAGHLLEMAGFLEQYHGGSLSSFAGPASLRFPSAGGEPENSR